MGTDLASTLLFVAVVLGGLVGLQLLLANKPGAEVEVKTLVVGASPPAWHFVALEYCYGILNRTYIVFVTERMICAAKVRGVLAAPVILTERWRDPYFYPRPRLVANCVAVDLESPTFLSLNGANFHLGHESIDRVEFSSDPKWGMGKVPYSGRLFLHLRDGRTKELILLGAQHGTQLKDRLLAAGFGRAAA